MLAREGVIPLTADERPQVTVLDSAGQPLPTKNRDEAPIRQSLAGDAPVEMRVRIVNPHPTLDFAPALVIDSDTVIVRYAFGDGELQPLEGRSLPLVGEHRLVRDGEQIVRVQFGRRDAKSSGTVRLSIRHHAFAKDSPSQELVQFD